MSKSKKSTDLTVSSKARKANRNVGPRGKAKIVSLGHGRVVGRSPGQLAAELTDPLAQVLKALKPQVGVDVIVVSDDVGRKGYVVETKYSTRKGRGKAAKGAAKTIRVTDVDQVYSTKGSGKSSLSTYLPRAFTPAVRPSTDELAERMLPETPIPSPAQAVLAQRESQTRWDMLEEFGALTSEELADQRSQAKNRHALANRWRSEGKIFAVELRGRRLYPGFQFDPETFAPESVVADALAALPREQMSDWEVALWWVASDPWLEGCRPVDLMQEDPEAVTAAAAGLSGSTPL